MGKCNTQFAYKVVPRGKWVPMIWIGDGGKTETNKKGLESLACAFGNAVFEQKKWAKDEGVSFDISQT